MVALALYIVILAICAGAGARLLKLLRAGDLTVAEELPFAAAIGLGTLSYLILGAGLLGYLRVSVAVGLILVLALVGGRETIRLPRRLLTGIRALHLWQRGALPLTIFLLAMLLFTLTGSLAPSGDGDYDSLVYHLAMPKTYVRDGGIHPIPWLSHSNFPFTLEMLYSLGLLLDGQSLAKLFHWGCGWLTAIAVFAFGRRWWGPRAGWLGAIVFAGVPIVAWQMITAYVELGMALYCFLALAALARLTSESRESEVEGRETESRPQGWLWVAALMCGWALGVKMLGGVMLLFAVAALGWGWLRRKGERREERGEATSRSPIYNLGIAHIGLFALIAVAVASPWYIKSYLWTGNPVYPFFYSLFDGRYWTAERAREYAEAQKAFGLGAGPLSFLSLPWNLTIRPQWFFDEPQTLRAFSIYVVSVGPVFLALLPALLVTGPVGAAGRLALWFALAYTAVWFGLTQNLRYLMALFPGLSACAGLAAARLLGRGRALAWAAALALVVGSLSGLFPAFLLAAPAARVAFGAETQSHYLARTSKTYRLFKEVEAATLPSARIMLLGDEPRTFYLDRHYLLGNHVELFSQADLATPQALLAALERLRVTHLLLGQSTLENIRNGSGLLETRLSELATEGRLKQVAVVDSSALWQIEDVQRMGGRGR
ncbi:MAG: hypothetical protein ACE149_18375 [Armatimonadota bacterium]